ncbi:hypothetical protein ACHAO4_000659 [Trichoderma viride]
MPNSYNITIKNQSGNLQQYALFHKAANNREIGFELINEYNAIVGKKKSNPSGTVTITVTGTEPIGGVCPVDFTKLLKNVVIVHDDHGNLTVQISA